jgi:hypothetical protein
MASILLMSIIALFAVAIAVVPVIVILARPTRAESGSTAPAVMTARADTAAEWSAAA